MFTDIQNYISEKFLMHPKMVCMSYVSHCKFSLYMAKLHAYGTYVSVVHAFFPWIYPSAVTELNQLIKQKIEENGCGDNSEDTKPEDTKKED